MGVYERRMARLARGALCRRRRERDAQAKVDKEGLVRRAAGERRQLARTVPRLCD